VEEFFLRRFLAGDELDIVDHQEVGRAQLLLELDGLVGRSAATNSTMNFSADM
jgi:hypothetical protein